MDPKVLNKFENRDYILSIVIALTIFLYIFLSGHLIGFVRDEGFYMKAGSISSEWFEHMEKSFLKGNFTAPFNSKSIYKYFNYNHEHPTLIKNMFGFSHYLFYKKLNILSFANSFRIVAAFFSALIALFVYIMGRLFFNRYTAILSPFLLFTMPHVFFHSHLACFDVPIMFFWFGTFLLFNIYLHNKSRKLAVFIAIFFGLAMAAKHNVFFIPILLFLNWLFFYILNYKRQEKNHRGFTGLFRAVPLPFYLFPVISLPVYILSWPWLWYQTVSRFIWYLNFHTKHVNYTNYYFGEELTKGPFPFSFPWVMTLLTTPLPQLILFAGGVFLFVKMVIVKRKDPKESEVYGNFISGSLFPIFLIALPSVPIFGGIKHWFTGYPLMLTAGVFIVSLGMMKISGKSQTLKAKIIATAVPLFVLMSLIPLNIKFAKHGPA